jgi:hypothetical protein
MHSGVEVPNSPATQMAKRMHVYEMRPRQDRYSGSHDALIPVFDEAGKAIEMHEH